jgi:hypothetical protein
MIISKIVKSKISTSTKEGKQYQAQQLYLTPLNSKEIEKLKLKEEDTVFISDEYCDKTKWETYAKELTEINESTVTLLKRLHQLMIEKMNPTQELSGEEREMLQKIDEVIKNE